MCSHILRYVFELFNGALHFFETFYEKEIEKCGLKCCAVVSLFLFHLRKKREKKEKELVFVRQGHHRYIGYSASTVHGSTLMLADSMGYGVPI